MDSHEEWWYRKLCEGHLFPAHSEWNAPVPKQALIDDYLLYAQRVRVSRPTNATQLIRFLEKCTPGLESFVATYRGRDSDGNPQIGRASWWKFPPVAACRDGFAKHLGGSFKWPEVTIKQEAAPQTQQPQPAANEKLPF